MVSLKDGRRKASYPWGRVSVLHLLLLALIFWLHIHLFVWGLSLQWGHGRPFGLRPNLLLAGGNGSCGRRAGVVVMDGPEGDGGRAAVLLKAIQVPGHKGCKQLVQMISISAAIIVFFFFIYYTSFWFTFCKQSWRCRRQQSSGLGSQDPCRPASTLSQTQSATHKRFPSVKPSAVVAPTEWWQYLIWKVFICCSYEQWHTVKAGNVLLIDIEH